MKNFLQNLLIFFAFCLCALIAFQWVRETRQNANLQKQANTIHDQTESILNLQAELGRCKEDIARLSALRDQLAGIAKTNEVQIANLTKEVEKNTAEIEKDQKQIEVYKNAIQKANENIVKQNDDIKKQNEELKRLAEERNAYVEGYNRVAARFNELGQEWNRMQEALSKGGSTNAPAANAAFVAQYNKAATKFSDLAGEWNKLQADLQKGATNAPADK